MRIGDLLRDLEFQQELAQLQEDKRGQERIGDALARERRHQSHAPGAPGPRIGRGCRSGPPPTVFTLPFCRTPLMLHGAVLFAKTLRVGFPTAPVVVIDNASVPSVRPAIQQAAAQVGARFVQIEKEIKHHEFVESIVQQHPSGAIVFLDPDVAFWEKVEDWCPRGLVAGRLLPEFDDPYTGCRTAERLHTSFLWIPDVAALRNAVAAVRKKYFEFEPFKPSMFRDGKVWKRFDTGGSLYAALTEQMTPFSVDELNEYDHLFCGSHFPVVAPYLPRKFAALWTKLHRDVRADHRALKGSWRDQEEFFRSHAA